MRLGLILLLLVGCLGCGDSWDGFRIDDCCYFGPSNDFYLTVNKAGDGTGRININPPGAVCDVGCAGPMFLPIYKDTNITITATPRNKSKFSGWSGDCNGNSRTCSLTMNVSHSVTANFSKR